MNSPEKVEVTPANAGMEIDGCDTRRFVARLSRSGNMDADIAAAGWVRPAGFYGQPYGMYLDGADAPCVTVCAVIRGA
jgi:hypothetical protein